MPRPMDERLVREGTGAGAAARVLLVANGIAHGWGLSSHRTAVTGALARQVAAALGRPCEVEFVGDAAMSAATAPLWLGDRATRSFDCAVIAIGGNDALRLTPAGEWESQLVELLDLVQLGLPAAAPVLLVGIPEVFPARRVRRMGAGPRLHGRRLDSRTRRVAASREDVRYIDGPDLRDRVGTEPDAAIAAGFAGPIADAVSDALRAPSVIPTTGSDSAPDFGEAFERPEVRTMVDAGRAGALQALEEITARARRRFGVQESAVTLLDGDRTWHFAHGGRAPTEVPHELTFCPIVTETGRPVIVEDTRRDPRFTGNGFLDLVHSQFYAGAPVHAADGTVIGALCLFHAFPRSARRVDLDALGELAREAENVIQAATAAQTLAATAAG